MEVQRNKRVERQLNRKFWDDSLLVPVVYLATLRRVCVTPQDGEVTKSLMK